MHSASLIATINDFLDFWVLQGPWGFIRIFWFYFIFEFPRYVLMDYVVFFGLFFWNKPSAEKYKAAKRALWSNKPLVSIIVPGKDEGENYQSLVDTLEEQTYQNYQLIVVDDGSEDQTEELGRKFEREGYFDKFLRNEVRGGKASAANLGLRYAEGEFVLHFDADCSFYRDAIEESIIPFYMDEEIGAVGGNLEVRNPDVSLCTTFQAVEYNLTVTIGRLVTSTLGILRIVSGAFGAFRKEALDQIGGWDVGPGLDGDITLKMRKLGYKIHFQHSAIALTTVPETFYKLAVQRIRWSRSLVRFRLRRHRDLFKPGKNFRLSTFFSLTENIFFHLVLNMLWYIYWVDIILNFRSLIIYILVAGAILYSISKFIEYLIVLFLSKRWKSKLKYILYLPGMVFYTGFFIRIIRSIAYVKEFLFKDSYDDAWNPPKTSRQAKKLDQKIAANN